MVLALLLALSTPASAGDFITTVSEDAVMSGDDIGGINWVRIFNNFADGGWWVTYHWETEGGLPGYNAARMTDERVLAHSTGRIRLAEWAETKDHAITRCPDGSFLHAFSIGIGNESARSARYSRSWETLSHEWVEENVPERAHNDLPVICSEPREATAFTNHASFTAQVFDIGSSGSVTSSSSELTGSGHMAGASWIYYEPRDQYLVISNGEPGLRRVWYNRDLSVAEVTDWAPLPALNRSFWPQKIERVGDYWVLIYLGIEYGGMYLADDGDVYLVVMDSSFNTVDSAKLSNNTPGDLGSARPHFARHGSKLMAVWDKAILPYAAKVQLNLEAFGVEDDDTGFDWADGDSDVDGGGDDPCVPDEDEDTDGTVSTETIEGQDETNGGHTSMGLTGTEDTAMAESSKDCGKSGCGCAVSVTRRMPWALLLLTGLVLRLRRQTPVSRSQS